MRLAPPNRDAPPLSCHLAGYTRSPAVVSFWFARSLIGIESPTTRRPRAFYSDIGINFIDTVSEYYAHLLRATGLLLCRLIRPQHRRPCPLRRCIYIAVTCALTTVLRHPSAQHYSRTCSPTRLLPHCFFFVQHNHTVGAPSLVRSVLATPTRAFVPDALLDLANPTAPRHSGDLTASTSALTLSFPPCLPSIASLPFFYVYDGPDCIDFGIAPSHDDCLDASSSLPWRPLCACSSIDTQPNHNYVDLGHL